MEWHELAFLVVAWPLSLVIAAGLGAWIAALKAYRSGLQMAGETVTAVKNATKGMGGGGHMNLMDIAGMFLQAIDLKKVLGGLMGGGKAP